MAGHDGPKSGCPVTRDRETALRGLFEAMLAQLDAPFPASPASPEDHYQAYVGLRQRVGRVTETLRRLAEGPLDSVAVQRYAHVLRELGVPKAPQEAPGHTCGPTRTGVAACPACRADAGICGRCGSAVAKPGLTLADGRPALRALFCDACVDRCHENSEFDHICQVCATPDEARARGWAVTR